MGGWFREPIGGLSDLAGLRFRIPGIGGEIMTRLGVTVQVNAGSTGFRGVVSISSGVVGKIDDLLDSFLASGGAIKSREDGLEADLADIDEERIELADRIASLEARLVNQYAALDILIAQFNSTSSFLDTQLQSLPEPNAINTR